MWHTESVWILTGVTLFSPGVAHLERRQVNHWVVFKHAQGGVQNVTECSDIMAWGGWVCVMPGAVIETSYLTVIFFF